jgi:hypothetical protein
MYNYAGLPESLQTGMKRYVEEGKRAGGFLTACLENDLMGAINRADTKNLPRLQEIIYWIYDEIPAGCWGSKGTVEAWQGERPDKEDGEASHG